MVNHIPTGSLTTYIHSYCQYWDRSWSVGAKDLRDYVCECESPNTEMRFILSTWLSEICSCSCLTVLRGPAWVLLNKICKE